MSLFRRRLMMRRGQSIDYSLYAIHVKKNPEVMAVVYANGWSASPEFMTYEEAASVTNAQLELAFTRNGQIKHFEEFKYFTKVTIIGRISATFSGFYGCSNLSVLELPPSLKRLSYNCLKNVGIISIDIPDSVNEANAGRSNWIALSGAFYGCSKLEAVRYSSNLLYVTSTMFTNCVKLREITNMDNVTRIGGWAFKGCRSLTEFTIPAGVTGIGVAVGAERTYTGEAFSGCRGLVNIICLPETPPTLDGTDNFYDTTCTISVPAESVESYKSAPGWVDIADRIIAINE